jgi:hypothetical protein
MLEAIKSTLGLIDFSLKNAIIFSSHAPMSMYFRCKERFPSSSWRSFSWGTPISRRNSTASLLRHHHHQSGKDTGKRRGKEGRGSKQVRRKEREEIYWGHLLIGLRWFPPPLRKRIAVKETVWRFYPL